MFLEGAFRAERMVRFSTQTVASKRLRVSTPDEEPTAMRIPTAPPIVTASASANPPPVYSAAADPTASGGVLATLDVDTLDCSVCMESLVPPIFQCSNGHIACHSCRSRISDVCPTCAKPMGSIRCLAIEKLIETLSVTCRYADNGCGEMPKFTQKSAHEKCCDFRPCSCPIKPCSFNGPLRSLSHHLVEAHQVETHSLPLEVRYTIWMNSAISHFLLKVEETMFLLHQDKEQLGNLVYLTYFGSSASASSSSSQSQASATAGDDEFSYQIEVCCGKKRLLFEGIPESLAAQGSSREFLMVPTHMYPREGHLHAEVSLRRIGSRSAKKKITFSESLF